MPSWLDSNALRVAGYTAAALAAFVAGTRERSLVRENPNLWPAFWFLTSSLFLLMALGRMFGFADVATQLARDEAHSQGWYADRRKFQAVVVASVSAIWFVAVVVALWRVPERRRRYLPMAFIAFSLVCFAGVRAVSLHQIDAVLYRRHLMGAKVGSVVEVFGILVAIAVTVWQTWSLVPVDPPPAAIAPVARVRGSR
jgi:hypothetical protein